MIRGKCVVCAADLDNVVSLDINTENNACINMYVYMPGNKNAGQIRKMKIESKSFEKFQDEIYGNISNKTKFDT